MDRPYNKYYYREPEKDKRGLKTKRKKRTFLRILMAVIIFLSLVALIRSPIFKLQRVEVSGNERISHEEIMRIGELEQGLNLWEVNNRVLRSRLERMPLVSSVRVSYLFPQALSIHLKEKEAVALVPYRERYLEISRDGTILGVVEEMKEDFPLVTGIYPEDPHIGQKIDEGEISYLTEILKTFESLSSQELSFFSDFKVKDPLNLIVYTFEGTEIWLGSGGFKEKLEEVPRIIMEIRAQEGEEPGYIDLRVSHFPSSR